MRESYNQKDTVKSDSEARSQNNPNKLLVLTEERMDFEIRVLSGDRNLRKSLENFRQ